jgi:hypothetical protein
MPASLTWGRRRSRTVEGEPTTQEPAFTASSKSGGKLNGIGTPRCPGSESSLASRWAAPLRSECRAIAVDALAVWGRWGGALIDGVGDVGLPSPRTRGGLQWARSDAVTIRAAGGCVILGREGCLDRWVST